MRHRLVIAISIIACLSAAGSPAAGYQLRHDPFAPPASAQATVTPRNSSAGGDMVLRGIIYDGELSLANIDGNIVPLHGEVAGYRLTEIARDRVVLMRNSMKIELMVNNDE